MSFENKPNNIINFGPQEINQAFIDKLKRTGEMEDIKADIGEQMAIHEERKEAGRETRGKWSIWVVDQEEDEVEGVNPVRFIVGKDEAGKFILMPNDTEHMHQEFIFSTDREAELAQISLRKQFPEIKADNFRVLCGGIDEEQLDKPQLRVIDGGKKGNK